MRTRIGTLVILGAGCVIAVAIGTTATMLARSHNTEMIAQITRSADQLAQAIASSTHDYMLENQRDKLHRQIQAIGSQQGIERIQIFNKEGRIMFSTEASDLGRALDKEAESCFACHAQDRPLQRPPTAARARIFHGPTGERVLGIVNPIPNEEGCWRAACHAHTSEESVLGVLDVAVSLADADRAARQAGTRTALIALLAIAAGSLVLWWINRTLVVRPVKAIAAGTRRVADGDLSTTIPDAGRHELGDLARAFNDMTRHLADARRQVTQAEKLASVGRLAAGVAHEINNPLTGVLTYASFLRKRADRDPAMRDDLDVIVRETLRCRDIVKGLLDFARQTPPKRQPVDLNEVTRRAVAVVMNQLTLGRVAVEIDLAPDLPDVSADANQIQQVLVNLLLNAADAIDGSGGSIHVTTRRVEMGARGNAVIRKATCPNGCDLIDPIVKIRNLPAIRVNRRCAGRDATVDLDPVYGRASHVTTEPCEEGAHALYSCPRCRASLDLPDLPCGRCGAGTFGVTVSGQDRVAWCTRKGCGWSLWEIQERVGARPWVECDVQDNGRGIPIEDQQHLFEPFFTTKGRRGTGLGLAVTWGIVESHGGMIEVASDPGRGSRFTVRLPVRAPDPVSATAAPPPDPVATGAGHA